MNKEKRICTITHHTVPNYGAVLQTYALQKAILKLGFDSEVLNYDSERVKNSYVMKFSQIKNFKQFIKFVAFPKERIRKQRVLDFVKKNVKVSEKRYKREELPLANNEYDLFITGSDQVWNLNIHKGDTSYMLDFVDNNNKKGSYAASFGYGEIPKEYKDLTVEKLKHFKFYNVREVQGKDILKRYIDKESNVVLDPTLLLSEKDYENIVMENNKLKDYVLVYNLTNSESLMEFARKIAEKNNLKLACINSDYKKVPNCININNASPEEFLGYIKNAKYVATSSFHGVVFSLIFNTQVFYELNNKKVNNNSRLENLAELFDLKNREIIKGKKIDEYTDIDYKNVNVNINEIKKESLNLLNEMLID